MSFTHILKLEDIGKVYQNGTIALQDLNLTICPGEFVSIVGASGCGKSTVLKLIAGLGSASSGNIEWLEPNYKKELAFVFQEAALMPWATVLENICLPLKLSGISKRQIKTRCADAIEI
ncbi:MAG: ATP-binding cassette domain-containing protein, partial [Xenococcaceae cyanobacterium]